MGSSLNGTGITFSNATTLSSAPVTSIATGNGLAGGTITTTGTLTLGAVTERTIGSYVKAGYTGSPPGTTTIAIGSNVSGSSINNSWQQTRFPCCGGYFSNTLVNPSLSGTWKYMGGNGGSNYISLWVRVA